MGEYSEVYYYKCIDVENQKEFKKPLIKLDFIEESLN
jgi:hypothetical protein